MVVNRVHSATLPNAPNVTEAELAEELARYWPEGRAQDVLSRMLRAAHDADVLAQRDQQGLERLRKSVGQDLPYVEVPAFERDVHDLGALSRLSHYLA